MTKTGLEFGILVIVICPSTWLRVVSLSNHLIFVIWDFLVTSADCCKGERALKPPLCQSAVGSDVFPAQTSFHCTNNSSNVKVNSSFGLWYNESQSVGKGF